MQIQKTNNFSVQNQQSFGLHIGKPCIETLKAQAQKGTDISEILGVVKELKNTNHARRYELRDIVFDAGQQGVKLLDSLTGAMPFIKNAESSNLLANLKQFEIPGKVEQLISEENIRIANSFVDSMKNSSSTKQVLSEIDSLV